MTVFGVLRAIDATELELMREWRNAPAVRENMYTRHEISQQEHLSWWTNTQQRQDQQYFMYEFNGVPAGIVGFTQIDMASANATWAFYASPQAPKGTGSRMEYLALEYAFTALKLNKLCCEVLAFNEAVIKLHKKFAFVVEGVLREQHRVAATFVDVYRLGLLAREWADQRPRMAEKLEKLTRG